VPADVHRKILPGNWFRTADDIGELEELAVIGDAVPLLIPQRPQHCQLLVGTSTPAFELSAARLDLFSQPAHADAQPKPSTRQRVDGRRPFGQHNWMMVGQHQNTGGQPEPVGVGG